MFIQKPVHESLYWLYLDIKTRHYPDVHQHVNKKNGVYTFNGLCSNKRNKQ